MTNMKNMKLIVAAAAALAAQTAAQPGGGGGGGVECPDNGGFTGLDAYMGPGAKAAPLRGPVACVDNPLTVVSDQGTETIASLIYGPMEAGFRSEQLSQFFRCSNPNFEVPGGIDTLTAEQMVEFGCDLPASEVSVLDPCGGHAIPYHYHERMTCLYESDQATGHSTRIATALDGNGLYGKYIDGGVVPTDLDACGGRTGVTPDSNGEEVYYYMVQDTAPFTVGCFGPASLDECRALYPSCGDDVTTLTTAEGSFSYDLDCPCYDAKTGSNLGASSPGGISFATRLSFGSTVASLLAGTALLLAF